MILRFGSSKKIVTRSLAPNKPALVTVLDVGTTKICCAIARLHPKARGLELHGRTHAIEVIGFGHQRSRGIKAGSVIDLDSAEEAIRHAVDAAERQAGMTVESIIVNVSDPNLRSKAFSASVSLSGQEVEDLDIHRVLAAGRDHCADEDGAVILHSQPIGYSLDRTDGIKDPRGMVGSRLGVDMHCVTAHDSALRNLELAINRCHLSVENFVATPYSSGLSALAGDETELGVACIDMGGGTTTVSIFVDGQFVHSEGIAIGGRHVTNDLARGLSTSLRDAEMIKVRHGSVLPGSCDDSAPVSVHQVADETGLSSDIAPSLIAKIIRPRVEETLELIRDRLNASGFASIALRRVVLTGGACQLTGMSDLARSVLCKNIRLGRPLGVTGLPMEARGAAFATVVGLMIFPQITRIDETPSLTGMKSFRQPVKTASGSYLGRVGTWIAGSF
ncbi:MAG: cell division protein FtsA [Pseudomonadota bacterium]